MTVSEESVHEALMNSTLALDRIARHEEECGRRWGLVIKLLTVTLAQLWGLLVLLLADKLGGVF